MFYYVSGDCSATHLIFYRGICLRDLSFWLRVCEQTNGPQVANTSSSCVQPQSVSVDVREEGEDYRPLSGEA